MKTKLSKLHELMDSGNWEEAILFASKFPRLGEQKRRIELGREAIQRPAFLIQIRKEPTALIGDAIEALRERYEIKK